MTTRAKENLIRDWEYMLTEARKLAAKSGTKERYGVAMNETVWDKDKVTKGYSVYLGSSVGHGITPAKQ